MPGATQIFFFAAISASLVLMAYTTHHGKRVSPAHKTMLEAYERAHGPVYINQGARTLAEQAIFYAHYLRYGRPVAARPWGGAPHIKWGHQHHAMDINAPEPAHSVAAYYRARGVSVAFNVANEPWHMDTLWEAQLLAAARRVGGHEHVSIRFGSRGPLVAKAKFLMRRWGLTGFDRSNRFGPGMRSAVKRLQKKHGLKADGVIGARTWKLLEKQR